MKKIVIGIFILIFQLIGFSDDFLGTWAINDEGADYEVFTILKIDDKYYRATKHDNYVTVDKLSKINGRLYLQTDNFDTYMYSYDKAKNMLIERKKGADYYETYVLVEDEDLGDCDLYVFNKDSKILKRTREDVEYQDFLGSYLDMEINKNEDDKYYISFSDHDFILNAKNKELTARLDYGLSDIVKIYFTKATKSFIDAFKLKNINVGDKILTVQYDDILGNVGEFYYTK